VVENLHDLIAAVRMQGADLGIAFDGDADRIGLVDGDGTLIWGDHILILYARDVLARTGGGQSIIFDVKCSQALPDAIAKAGGTPVMWKTGHSLIKDKMKELHAPIAGEMSGHMFFAEGFYGHDDALYGAARLLRIVADSGRSVQGRNRRPRSSRGDSRGPRRAQFSARGCRSKALQGDARRDRRRRGARPSATGGD
jgi:phosphomannomutase